MYSYGLPHMGKQKQDDQLELTYSSYVMIQDVTLKTCQRWWMIGRSRERGSGISVPAARHDDIIEYIINYMCKEFSVRTYIYEYAIYLCKHARARAHTHTQYILLILYIIKWIGPQIISNLVFSFYYYYYFIYLFTIDVSDFYIIFSSFSV